jgi:3'-phosphoadenosine 5'-phosphosulfate sulfotransferase (PAPS reductase)/FAD synthetase
MKPTTWAPSPSATVVLACSGGKDSTAAGLWLREQGIKFRAVFYDTGWESDETYRYVETVLPEAFGVEVEHCRNLPKMKPGRLAMAEAFEAQWMAGRVSPMVRWVIHKAMFPSTVSRRWCTSELKVASSKRVAADIIDAGGVPVFVVGVRADESEKRAKLPEVTLGDAIEWRPLLSWTRADVYAIHRRAGVALNPLYEMRDIQRVGCWPCIGCRKGEIREIARRDPHRIDTIRALEALVAPLAAERTGEGNAPAFFQARRENEAGERPCTPIDEMVDWSRTLRGGEERDDQLSMLGCMSGLCDA